MRLEWTPRRLLGERAKLDRLRALGGHFGPLVRKERATLALAFAAGSAAAVMTIARPWPLKIVFDHVLGSRPYRGWLAPLGGLAPESVVALVSALFLGLVLIEGLLTYGQQVLTAKAGQRVVAGLRKKLFHHLVGLSVGFHRRSRTGDLIMRLTGDIQMLRDMLVDGAVLVTAQTFLLLGMLAVAAALDPVLAGLSLLVIPLLTFASLRLSRGIRAATHKQRKKEGLLASSAGETLSAIAVIQALGREQRHIDEFAAQNSASLKQGLRTTRLEARLARIAELTTAAGLCAVLYAGTLRATAGQLTPGELIVFLSYLTIVYRPIRRIARMASRLAKAMVCAERVADVLETRSQVVERRHARPAPRFQGHIEFRSVSYAYPGRKRRALDRVSLTIEPGEVIAVAGPVGSGKSTLASLLVRLFDPDDGRVRIDGADIRELTLASLRAGIAVVPQDSMLLHASVEENLAYAADGASPEALRQAACAVGAGDFIERLPDGYATVLGEKGANLSSGQRQLLALARALVKDAPIVILDEPTANLDALSRRAVREALRVLLAGRTALLVTHTLSEALDAHRVVVMRKGRIVEAGAPASLASAGGWFQRALTSQRGGTLVEPT